MINIKKMLLAIAIVSAVVVVMSQTVTLFSGQHGWYNLSESGSNVPCEKCHADIRAEMNLGGPHKAIMCEGCHRTDASVGGYAGTGDWGEGPEVYPGKGAHAASTQECMICHAPSNYTHHNLGTDTCTDCHDMMHGVTVPVAGGFDLTGDPDDTAEKAAHLTFVLEAMHNSSLLAGSNEACIACHTGTPVNVSHHIPQGYEIELNRTCGWEVDFSYYNFTDVEVSG